MIAVIAALAFQVAWTIAKTVLVHEGVSAGNSRVVALSVASLVASYVVIAAAAVGLARRLHGTRRVGMWIAACGAIGLVIGIAVYEGLMHSTLERDRAVDLAIAVRVRGWSAADAIVILGFAIAAGRRGIWLAPPTIGLALLDALPGANGAAWPAETLVVLLVVKSALLAFMARDVERHATPCEPEPERARAGLQRCERATWLAAAVSLIWVVAWWLSPTIYVDLPTGCAIAVVGAVFASGAWTTARAALRPLSRWPWYVASMFSVWGVARTARSWTLAVVRNWGNLEGTPLKPAHWYVDVPGLLASLCAAGALVVFAHRTRARDARWAACVAIAFSVSAFGVQCALPEQVATRATCSVLASIAAALAFRMTRHALHGDLPRARVV